MRMEKVRLKTLSESVRSFLARVRAGKGLVVEDEQGRPVATVLPAPESEAAVTATPEEREQAWKRIQRIQRKASKSMDAQGVTEDDLVREILKDD